MNNHLVRLVQDPASLPPQPQARQHDHMCSPLADKLVGIEVELENAPDIILSRFDPLWAILTDGSLRNNGKELVSLPVSGELLIEALNQLQYVLTAWPVTASYRTSVHVHVNITDEETTALRNILRLYPIVEPLMFQVFARGRNNSQFCVPWLQDKKYLSNALRVARALPNVSVPRVAAETRHTLANMAADKYSALNLGSIYSHGTIEFRHHPGTLSIEKIYNWVMFILRFIEVARNTSVEYNRLSWSSIGAIYNQLNVTSTYAFPAVAEVTKKLPMLSLLDKEDSPVHKSNKIETPAAFNKYMKVLRKDQGKEGDIPLRQREDFGRGMPGLIAPNNRPVNGIDIEERDRIERQVQRNIDDALDLFEGGA